MGGRRLAPAVLALVLVLVAADAASAASWLPAQRIEPGQGTIYGLSCPSALTCVAASSVPVIQDGGPSFEPATDPDPGGSLAAVSCAPTTRFCMFTDAQGKAFSYDSGTFADATTVSTAEFESVSCPSPTFCMAVDHNLKVFKYSGGGWDGGTTLTTPGSTPTNTYNLACASTTFCLALASTDTGERSFTWNGSTWSSASASFDVGSAYVVSLSCTSVSFCLATDEAGNALVNNGSSWSSPAAVDNVVAHPKLYSACAGTACVAVDYFDNAFATTNGTTWAPNDPANLHAGTGISGITSITCASASLCVAGDGLGNATTFAVPPNAGVPSLAGNALVGQALTLTHAPNAAGQAWYYDDWRRCDNPDAGCGFSPISTSASSYTLQAADTGEYIDVRETVGFGFDEEGPLTSNIVGPVSDGSSPPSTSGGDTTPPPTGTGSVPTGSGGPTPAPGKAKLSGKPRLSKTGVVTITLSCSDGPCAGRVTLKSGAKLGSARYSLAAGKSAKVKIKLNAAGKKLLKKRHGKLTVTLVITPASGKQTTQKLKLTAAR